MSSPTNEVFADDLLRGAGQIAKFLFGTEAAKTSVYHQASRGQLPVFRLGGTLCARRSTLTSWIAAQEASGIKAA